MQCMLGTPSHAKSYPFPVPGRSYLFRNGKVEDLGPDGFDRAGRTPVLAAGSNQSHEQLTRKYSVLEGHVEIPVQRGKLGGFDSVYAAHLAGYGSVPSTFYPSPKTQVTTYVLWLDDAQLNRMHETERNYTYDRLENIQVEIDGEEVLTTAYAYTAVVGCLNVNGAPAALSEISAEGRTFPAMTQTDILDFVRERLAPDRGLDEFIAQHIADEKLRRARTSALSADSIPAEFDRTVLRTY